MAPSAFMQGLECLLNAHRLLSVRILDHLAYSFRATGASSGGRAFLLPAKAKRWDQIRVSGSATVGHGDTSRVVPRREHNLSSPALGRITGDFDVALAKTREVVRL